MKLSRRELVAGVSAGAVAVATVFGSGAFTRTETDREFSLAIAPDDQSLLEIVPSGVDSQVVAARDGVLSFETDELGLNTGATATVGRFAAVNFDDPVAIEREAFLVRNNTQEEIDVTFDLTGDRELDSDSRLKFVLTETQPTVDDPVDIENATVVVDGEAGTVEGLAPGGDGELYGGLLVDAGSDRAVETTLRIRAERSDTP